MDDLVSCILWTCSVSAFSGLRIEVENEGPTAVAPVEVVQELQKQAARRHQFTKTYEHKHFRKCPMLLCFEVCLLSSYVSLFADC